MNQANTVSMNPYFKPRTPEPRTGAFDIVIGSLMCAIVVLVVGVGIWMVRDTVDRKSVSEKQAELEQGGPSNEQVVVHVPDPPR